MSVETLNQSHGTDDGSKQYGNFCIEKYQELSVMSFGLKICILYGSISEGYNIDTYIVICT